MKFPFGGSRAHRHAGDAHRSVAEWPLAAAAYRRHLIGTPLDQAIWVQLGHAEKEQGNFADAEEAYQRAVQIKPQDADAHFHLAHLLKKLARFDDAADAFLALSCLKPTPDILTELDHMISLRRRRNERVAAKGAVIFSMQDIFNMFAVQVTASGIQRVQAGIALAVITEASFDSHFVIKGEHQDGAPTFLRLREQDLLDILTYVAGKGAELGVLQHMLVAARFRAVPITLGAGATVVLLGSFWDEGNGIEQYLDARRRGARIIPLICDIIPITHPEYCDATLVSVFWRTLAELIYASDYVFTISDFTQFEMKRFIAEHGGRQIPMQTVPLAHSMVAAGEITTAAVWPRALARLKGRRYAAYISTIEGRKNHLFVVKVWQEMIARGVDVPDLVFVGRKGWKIDPLTEFLNETNNLNGKIHIVHGLSDAELNGVYAGAMFTVFTSIVEGWGLPVGESLAHGVPCVVTRAASMPEVGGDYADYVTSDNQEGAIETLRRFIEDDSYLAARRKAIEDFFETRTWEDVGLDFTVKLRAILNQTAPPQDFVPVTLAQGSLFRPGDLNGRIAPLPGYLSNPIGLILLDSFYRAEPWGAWMRGTKGELSFTVNLPEGTQIIAFLALKATPWAVSGRFSVTLNDSDGEQVWHWLAPDVNHVRIKGQVGAGGACQIGLFYEGQLQPHYDGTNPDKRRFALGLTAIGYAQVDDISSRAELREDCLFG